MRWVHHRKQEPEWQRWFAWFPAHLGSLPLIDGHPVVWLEWVERKWTDERESGLYEYRAISNLKCGQAKLVPAKIDPES